MYYSATRTDELQHHGVKGMKWGVRRYQNADGTLTEAGRKKLSKKYKKYAVKVNDKMARNEPSIMVRAYNQTADEYNDHKIAEFNKTHDPKSEDYLTSYYKKFDDDVSKNYSRLYLSELKNNKNFRKAQELGKKYSMETFDDLVKDNNAFVEELRKNF